MMNALDQYINLYREHREAVEAHAPAAFNALRPAALRALGRFGRFPSRGEEGYEKTDIDGMFAPDFGVNVNRVPFDVDVASTFKCGVPNLSTLLGVVVGDTFRPTATLLKNMPEGVTMMSLAEAAGKFPEGIARLDGIAAGRTTMSALNTLLLQDGVYIRVERGVQLEKPLQLVNIFNAMEAVAYLFCRRECLGCDILHRAGQVGGDRLHLTALRQPEVLQFLNHVVACDTFGNGDQRTFTSLCGFVCHNRVNLSIAERGLVDTQILTDIGTVQHIFLCVIQLAPLTVAAQLLFV